jgi:D-arabinose 1-dehydrogenase-like Zn-dependent alcohol dehydrogenase
VTYHAGYFGRQNPLVDQPWTQWLTWPFQAVPTFFLVAGYAGAVSWTHRRDAHGVSRQTWLRHRLARVLGPTAVYAVLVSIAVVVLGVYGVDGSVLEYAGWAVAMHLWFLAVYPAIASSEQKLNAAASYGASNLVDTRRVNLREALRKNGADIVVDPVGGDLSEPALRALRWGGRFVTVGYASGAIPRIPLNLVLLKGISIHGIELHHFAANAPKETVRDQQELMQLLASGRVIPHIGAVYALDEVAAALRCVADRSAVGKVVLDISP